MAQLVKNPSAMWETWVGKISGLGRSLGWEDPLEKGRAPCTVHGVGKSRTQLSNFHFHFFLCKVRHCGKENSHWHSVYIELTEF